LLGGLGGRPIPDGSETLAGTVDDNSAPGHHESAMKKVFLGTLVIMLGFLAQSHAQIYLPNGLVAYYPFDGNANDVSGNGNNLTVYGATLCADRFGHANHAYSFNGASSYLGAANPPLTQIDDWTMTAWVQPASLNQAEAYAVCMGYDNGNSGNGYAMGVTGGSQVTGFFGGVGSFGYGYSFPSTNQWYHIAMLRDAGSTMFFINGAEIAGSISYLPETPTSFQIGSATGIRFWTGAIDEVRIYNLPLSPLEVQELYQYDSTPFETYQATAIADVDNGFVVGVTVTYPGYGYTNTPAVTITGGGGSGAQAVAVVSNGVVIAVNVLDAGTHYTNAPTVLIAAPLYPFPATAVGTISNGFLVGASVVYGGNRYTNAPSVKIVGGGGSGAEAVAVVSNGAVVAIDVTDAGFGYTNAPLLVIDPPFIPNPLLGNLTQTSILTFTNLTVGDSYQFQQLTEGEYWTNLDANFTATNSVFTQVVPGLTNGGEYRLALSPVPIQAFAVPEVVNGFVVGATVTSGGSGYTTNPAVSIVSDDAGTNAAAVAQVFDGVVTNIMITSAGIGYTNAPTIEIAPPPTTSFSPTVQTVLQVPAADLAPYDNYQVQFTPALGAPWENWPGGLFVPTSATNTQYLIVTNTTAFFRLEYVP
jgi:hypothetical protein